jgi:hypothetical protein
MQTRRATQPASVSPRGTAAALSALFFEPSKEDVVKSLLGMLSIAGGFVVSLGMFAAGLLFAAWFIAAEPAQKPHPSADVASLWTAEPRRIDTAAQHLERVPALLAGQMAQPASARIESAFASDASAGPVDPVTTGSVQPAQQGPSNGLPTSHEKWCAERYRSYRPHDDSYTSYSGEVRPCISPFVEDTADNTARAPAWVQDELIEDRAFQDEPIEQTGDETQGLGPPPQRYVEDQSAALEYASDAEAGGWIDSDHMAYCFSRYRSYRPEDNTYQPFGGGPRRQCE